METELCANAPSSWAIRSIEDICQRVTSGGTPSRSVADYYQDGEWPWVKTQELVDGWIDDTEEHITFDAIAHSSAKTLPKNTVLMAMYGATVGQLGILRKPMTCNQACCAMIVDDESADFRYLYYILLLSRPELKSLATGAAQQNLSASTIKSLEIPLPPLPEQRRIAKILGDLDDKIELNRKMNETLEQMARALFKSWFVDFDPVRAKMEGRTPSGMDAATAALFPDRLVDSELGPIPEGWEVGVLDELTRIVIGGDWGATEPTDIQNVACFCVRGADIPSLQEGGMGKMPTRYLRPSSIAQRQLFDGDLVIEISGGSPTQSTGRPVLVSDALLQVLQRPIVASNFCRIVKLKKTEYSKYVYYWLRSLYDAGALFQYENGTTGIKNFAFTLFSASHHLLIPNSSIARSFNTAVSSLLKAIQHNANQSHTLSTLRDTLLPKLVGGEVRVNM